MAIGTLILDWFLGLIDNYLPAFPDLVIPDNVFNYLLSLFRTLNVFLPIKELMPIIIFSISVTVFRLGYTAAFKVREMS